MSKDSNYKLNKEELERAKDYFEIWMMAGFGGDAEMTAIRRTAYKAIKYCLASLFSDGGGDLNEPSNLNWKISAKATD